MTRELALPKRIHCCCARVGPWGNFWSFLCRDVLQDEQLLDNMESAEHDLEGEVGTKTQPRGLVFKIASKRKCGPTGSFRGGDCCQGA